MKKTYDSKSIKVLEGLDAVRIRPGMYIGSTGSKGLHHLIWEVVDNAIDETLAGHAKSVTVTLHSDGCISVQDDGRGIPVDKHPSGPSTLEVILTKLHAGGKFDNDSYEFSSGLHGVGISVVNALSESLEAYIYRDKKIYNQNFSRGNPVSKLTIVGDTKLKGTLIKFKPDKQIFETVKFDANIIKTRLQELAFLNKSVTINFIDEKGKQKYKFNYSGGIVDYMNEIGKGKFMTKPVYVSYDTKINGKRAEAEVAIAYFNDSNNLELSFANNIKTIDGGTHVSGFRSGFTKIINELARDNKILKDKDNNFQGTDIREGLCFVVTVKLAEIQFESQTKDKLGSVSATNLVYNLVVNQLKDVLSNSNELPKILNKIKLMARARAAAKSVKEAMMNKSSFDSALPGKLASCTSRKPEECELYLVEG